MTPQSQKVKKIAFNSMDNPKQTFHCLTWKRTLFHQYPFAEKNKLRKLKISLSKGSRWEVPLKPCVSLFKFRHCWDSRNRKDFDSDIGHRELKTKAIIQENLQVILPQCSQLHPPKEDLQSYAP